MKMMLALHIVAVFLISTIKYVYADIPMYATEIRMCENKTYPYQLSNIKLRIKDDYQEIKMKVNLARDVNDDPNFVVTVERFLGNKMKKIINMKNKGPCTTLITYGGETLMGGVRHAKFPHPDRCPFEKGTYNLDWYKINFDTIPMVKLVPKGKFKLTIEATDPSSGKELACVIIVVEKN